MSTEHTPPASGGGTPTEGTPADRTPDTQRHRRSTLIAVSVAAAVLLAGGGGAYWASTASDGEGDGGAPAAGQGDPPPLELDGYSGGGSPGSSSGIAPGEPDPAGARYHAQGTLPDGPESAPVYRAQAEVSRAQAERLAKALGVRGAPRLVQDTWKFGLTRDASGPTLEVSKKAPGTWTYVRYGKGGAVECTEPPMSGPKDGKGGEDASTAVRCPAPGDLSQGSDGGEDGAGPVSEEKAKKAVGPALEGIGLSDAKLDARQTMGAIRVVNADPVLGGLPTYGWHTGLQVGSDGQVVGGSGHLTELKKGAEYPVLGAAETMKELNKSAGGGGGVGIGGCASAVPHEGAVGIEGGGKAKSKPCATPGEATPKQEQKPKPVEVRDAVFGLAVHLVAGQQALVPSWMFEAEQPGATGPRNTFTVTHPAVQRRYIAEPSPSQAPSRAPGTEKPGDRPTGEPARPGGGSGPAHIESYSADGRTLTLSFWGGVCSDYSASADASSGTVKAQVTGEEKEPGKKCIKIAKQFEKKVTLDKPLGDRKVVDASTGTAVPKKE
ncbi:hypothetical protein ABZW18_02375 [Streptomyces sp. NPDC004647]|uniref:hypothetical protein n=1 Tax=Streptomyces sp. NPDC004647 TaxID=3154671 RepID=UPI0033A8EEE5